MNYLVTTQASDTKFLTGKVTRMKGAPITPEYNYCNCNIY